MEEKQRPDTYVAIIKRAHQINESEWDTWEECLVCDSQTTVENIHNWVKKRTGFGGNYAAKVNLYFAEMVDKER